MRLLNIQVILSGYLCAALVIFVVALMKNGKLKWFIPFSAVCFPLIVLFVIAEAITMAIWLVLRCLLERVRLVKCVCRPKPPVSAGGRPETRLLPPNPRKSSTGSGSLRRGFVPSALRAKPQGSRGSRAWNHSENDPPHRCARRGPRNPKRT
jgi:hypothetical protein